MKRLLVAAGLLLAGAAAGTAEAADLPSPVYKAPAVAPAPLFSWSGFYIGGNAGYGWGGDAVALSGDTFSLFLQGLNSGVFPNSLAADPRGYVAGGQIGWNYQMGQVVFGVEADFDAADIKSSGIVVGTIGVPRTLSASERLDSLATFRARLGFTPVDRLLLYVTGGGAAGGAKLSASLTTNDVFGPGSGCVIGTCETASRSSTQWGWSVGGGAEYAFFGNWSLKAEYLHYDLGTLNITAQDPVFPVGTNVLNASAHFRGDVVRGGVNFRFGP